MNFEKFETWIKRHPLWSIVLVILFCLSVGEQIWGYSSYIWSCIFPSNPMRIVNVVPSSRYSVYQEIQKNGVRKFIDARKLKESDQKSSLTEVETAHLIMRYAVQELEIPDKVKEGFKTFFQSDQDTQNDLQHFISKLIDRQTWEMRLQDGNLVIRKYLVEYDDIQKNFLKALESYYYDPLPYNFTLYGNPVSQERIDNAVKEYIALFHGEFFPVLEIQVENTSQRALVVDKIGVEVQDLELFLGLEERVPTSRLISISITSAKGMNEKELSSDEQIYLEAGQTVRILVRLEPEGGLALYQMKIYIYAGDTTAHTPDFEILM